MAVRTATARGALPVPRSRQATATASRHRGYRKNIRHMACRAKPRFFPCSGFKSSPYRRRSLNTAGTIAPTFSVLLAGTAANSGVTQKPDEGATRQGHHRVTKMAPPTALSQRRIPNATYQRRHHNRADSCQDPGTEGQHPCQKAPAPSTRLQALTLLCRTTHPPKQTPDWVAGSRWISEPREQQRRLQGHGVAAAPAAT